MEKKSMKKLEDSDNVWIEAIRNAIRLFDYEKAINLLAANEFDQGDLDAMVTRFCTSVYAEEDEPPRMEGGPAAELVKHCTLAVFRYEDGHKEVASDVSAKEVLSYFSLWIQNLQDVMPDED